MPRIKHKKLAVVRTFENVFDYKKENVSVEIKRHLDGKTVTLELGCGSAEYTINLARMYPKKLIIGVDRKPSRIFNGAKYCRDNKINNAAFLIGYAESLSGLFPQECVEEIWITFPDPYPRRSSMKKRLTHPRFLEAYKNILVKNGKINLKTDDETLYNYTLDVIEKNNLKLIKFTDNLYLSSDITEEEKIITKYEKQHLEEGKKIKLVRFCF